MINKLLSNILIKLLERQKNIWRNQLASTSFQYEYVGLNEEQIESILEVKQNNPKRIEIIENLKQSIMN